MAAVMIFLMVVTFIHALVVAMWGRYKRTTFVAAAMTLWFPFVPWVCLDLTWDSILYSSLELVSATAKAVCPCILEAMPPAWIHTHELYQKLSLLLS